MADVSHVELTLKRISAHRGVVGHLIFNADGIPIRSTFEPGLTNQYAALVSFLATKARLAVKRIDRAQCASAAAAAAAAVSATTGSLAGAAQGPGAAPEDELLTVRVRSKKHELIVAPQYVKGQEYTLVIVQDPAAA